MNYKEAREYIKKASQYGIVPGLDNISNLCDKLGNPQNELDVIHVAGTNGKGSVGAFAEQILIESGKKVGRYVSPSVFDYLEQFRINAENMSELDYNGMFEYLYGMKYGEKFTAEKEVVGIPAEEFENVIMTYLPVTKEELKEWAVYDEQSNMFIWERLGCGNYSPTHFGLSLPEVTEVRHNEDGTIVLTIHAVCDSVVCNDVVITHELTMKIQDDGTIQYVGNRILDNGIDNIPRYQYRLGNLQN